MLKDVQAPTILEESINEHIQMPCGSERQQKISAMAEAFQRWLLGLSFDAPENEITIKTVYRKSMPNRPHPVVLVFYSHTVTDTSSFVVEPEGGNAA